MNIELTQKEKDFLSEFAAKQYEGAHDNVGTATPIHVVERREKVFVYSEYGDDWQCEDLRYQIFGDFNAMLGALIRDGKELPAYEDVEYADEETTNGVWIDSEKAYCEAYGINAVRGQIITTYRPVAFFLIRDEAVRYMEGYQAHNCEDCRVYTYGLGYSNNGDLPIFRNLLLKMGRMLNAENAQKKENVFKAIKDFAYEAVREWDWSLKPFSDTEYASYSEYKEACLDVGRDECFEISDIVIERLVKASFLQSGDELYNNDINEAVWSCASAEITANMSPETK